MPTKKQLEQEVDDIRTQLYQERQDHASYVRDIKETAYNIARERMRVKAVLVERERCAKLCEDSNVFDYDDPGGFFANLIRGQD